MSIDLEGLEVHEQKAPETKVVGRLKLDPPIVIVCHSRLRRFAAKNALTLIWLNIYFPITWGVIYLANR